MSEETAENQEQEAPPKKRKIVIPKAEDPEVKKHRLRAERGANIIDRMQRDGLSLDMAHKLYGLWAMFVRQADYYEKDAKEQERLKNTGYRKTVATYNGWAGGYRSAARAVVEVMADIIGVYKGDHYRITSEFRAMAMFYETFFKFEKNEDRLFKKEDIESEGF